MEWKNFHRILAIEVFSLIKLYAWIIPLEIIIVITFFYIKSFDIWCSLETS